jgi:hypothetical protein
MAERETAWWLYCVVRDDDRPSLDGLTGVAGAAVEPIAEGELCALASSVPLDEFGEQPLHRNLEDVAWVERTARAHDGVLTRALACDAVLPLRMCTLFVDQAHVRALLRDDRAALADALRRLRGHAEWSVKTRVDLARLAEQMGAGGAAVRAAHMAGAPAPGAAPEPGAEPEPGAAPGPGADPGAGRAFFARKRAEDDRRERTLARATDVAEEVHARLSAVAADARLLPPQRRELSGLPGTMLLNGAYLVARDDDAAFSAAVSDLSARHRAEGFAIDVSGPWAPYNFVSTEEEPSDERSASAAGDPTA